MRSLGVGERGDHRHEISELAEIHIKLYGLDLPTCRGTSYYQH